MASGNVAGEEIVGIGLSGQMHGLVLLDSNREVLRPAILWNDQRSSLECDQIRNEIGVGNLIEIAGNDAFPGFTLPKLLWVKNNEPEIYERIASVLLPKDYIRLLLTGEFATDKAGAGGTLMLDLATREWSAQLLDAFEIDHDWMPSTFEGTEVTGHVSDGIAEGLGLSSHVPVFGGAGDQAAQAVGSGAVTPDVWTISMGTSGVVFAACDEPVVESNGSVHSFPHAIPDKWHMMGVMLSASGSLEWYRSTFAPEMSYEDLLSEAEAVPAGCEGLFFQPYLTGERTPHADPTLRGSFVGLTSRHGRGHLTRAVLEGVAFGLRDNAELLKRVGLPAPKQIRVSGGGAKSPLWRQILSDVLGHELITLQASEGAAFGAAILAGVGAGLWSDAETACTLTVETDLRVAPDSAQHRIYTTLYSQFQELHPLLSPFYRS